VLTSAKRRWEVVPGRLRLLCLSLSRRVRFTNRFTNQSVTSGVLRSLARRRGCLALQAAIMSLTENGGGYK
jgi:hypothetical protein